mgnify:CR=1 FL=1
MHAQNAIKWYQIESEQLGRSLTVQAAKLIASPMAREDEEAIAQYVSIMGQGMFVKGAVLFDDLGVRYVSPIDEQNETLSVLEITRQNDIEALVFVEDIVFEGKIIGYIKLLLDKQAITEHHRNFNNNQLCQTILIILLSIIAAGLATRLFYKVRLQYKTTDTDADLPWIEN